MAKKVVPLFNLCNEQFSSQLHYDFGLRALKAVLVAAGRKKRQVVTTKDRSIDDVSIAIIAGVDGDNDNNDISIVESSVSVYQAEERIFL